MKDFFNRSRLIMVVSLMFFLMACDSNFDGSTKSGSFLENTIDFKFYYDSFPVVNFETMDDDDIVEPRTLFSSEIFLENPNSIVQNFKISLFFDPSVMVPVNFMSPKFIVDTNIGDGVVVISASGIFLEPSDYTEILTITWEALRTNITEVTLKINELGIDSGEPILPTQDFSETIRILLLESYVIITGTDYSVFEDDIVHALVSIDPGDHRIYDFDLDLFFDTKRLDIDYLDEGYKEILLDDFDIKIEEFEDRIHITGFNEKGLPMPEDDGKVDIVRIDFRAKDSGLAKILIETNRMVTLDDVYLNPIIEELSQVISPEDGTPPMVFWFEPAEIDVKTGDTFTTVIHVNTENYNLAAYGCYVYYDQEKICLDNSGFGGKQVEAGKHGFITIYNDSKEKKAVIITGFSVTGMPELGKDLEFLVLRWKALAAVESSEIKLKFDVLSDDGGIPIPRMENYSAFIHVNE
ncbi:MAG: hypothetical protein JXR70_04735 [Spirochaetales bacterium]|nr:hypothetical protein [Spirochaetales bacterium]